MNLIGAGLPPLDVPYAVFDPTWVVGALLVFAGGALGSLLACLLREAWRGRRQRARRRRPTTSSLSRQLPAVAGRQS